MLVCKDYDSTHQSAWLELFGPDAADFLHRLSCNDVKGLKANFGQLNAFLSSTGKFEAVFYLWRKDLESFWIEIPWATSPLGREAFEKVVDFYHFGEDFELKFIGGSQSAILLTEHSGEYEIRKMDDEKLQFVHSKMKYGLSWISQWESSDLVLDDIREITRDRLVQMRIDAGSPEVGFEITPDSNPLEASCMEVVSQQKGCYPGQEVIEKIISIGRPARTLVRLRSENMNISSNQGSRILNASGAPLGVITTPFCNTDKKEKVALALIRGQEATKSHGEFQVDLGSGQTEGVTVELIAGRTE